MFDPEGLFRCQDEAGVDLSVVSNPMIFGPGTEHQACSMSTLRTYNDFAADLQAQHPKKLAAMASAYPFGDDSHLRETERAIRDGRLHGVAVNSSIEGEY